MKIKWSDVICLLVCVCLAYMFFGCSSENVIAGSSLSEKTENSVADPLNEENIENTSAEIANGVDTEQIFSDAEYTETTPTVQTEPQTTDFIDTLTDPKLIEAIEQNVILSEDTQIEAYEWVDEEKSCLRIRVRYKEQPPKHYLHKEDYFFFLKPQQDVQVLHVDYPGEDWDDIDMERYVWSACDFEAYFEDVTFDGQDDLLISLGYAGAQGARIFCVYIYEDGVYRYEKSFEDISNYVVDTQKRVIRATNRENASETAHFVYEYRDDVFVQISMEIRSHTQS